ncbi:hypothetical protein G210_5665 [Candida maltosa Xu316]|uniref:L domain-like protein n=1 Tax=Candida maltosa (strain Xu316) TaxID=1245528 RepID=M3ISK0_CANMX|nr:hypothetical protein G210_5665 [Candida maltosa Xu316]
MNDDDDFLRSFFPILPDDVILLIVQQLPLDYLIECLIKVPNVQNVILDEYYNRKDIQFEISPTNRPYMNHVPMDRKKLTTFKGYYQINTFIKENLATFIPRTILIVSGGDWQSLEKLIIDYKTWFDKVEFVEIALENYTPTPANFLLFLELKNLSKILFSHVSLQKCRKFLQENELLINHPHLNNIIFLKHDISNWNKIELPRGLKSLDLSWESNVNPSTVSIPGNVEELYLNLDQIEQIDVVDLKKCWDHLTTLMLTYNSLTSFSLKQLPPNLKTLDLSSNAITDITDVDDGWPDLDNLLLGDNKLTDLSLESITQWPPNLKSLRLSSNKIKHINNLKGLPDSTEVLDLSNNLFTSLLINSNQDCFVFPKKLKTLRLFCCDISIPAHMYNYLEFPDDLQELDLTECNLKSLTFIKFPPSLIKLALSGNKITDLSSYNNLDKNWSYLQKLQELDLYSNSIEDLVDWLPPPNVKLLHLGVNPIKELSSNWPLFDANYNDNLKLNTLSFSSCEVKSVSPDLQIPPALKVLTLSNNLIDGKLIVPKSFKLLRKLDLSINQIEDISFVPGGACNLYRINLAGNKIRQTNVNRESIQELYNQLERELGVPIPNKKFKVNTIHTLC